MTHTLLLADDSVTIQRVIELTFADEDVQVVTVGDGDQAIARLEERPPDIVLADVAMPGKSGYEVSSYIKRSDRLSHIPVLLLTGAFEPVDQRKVEEAGCDGVLAKPFEPQLVIGRVRELLGLPAGARGVVEAAAAAAVGKPGSPGAPASAGEAGTNGAGAKTTSLVDYLDQLDAALANRASAQAQAPTRSAASPDRTVPASAAPERETEQNHWDLSFGVGSDEVAAQGPPQADVEPSAGPLSSAILQPAPPAPLPETVVRALAGESTQPALPALADAFAALLAAEHDLSAAPSVAWPTQPQAVVSEEVVEQVVRRVLDRLSDRVVRETVTEIASAAAERLVREEIDRIKAQIK